MAAEDPGPEPARGPPAVWYRSWRFYLVLVLVVWAYAYVWRVTQINLGELWWENQIGQRQQLGSLTTDAQGRLSLTFAAPEVLGTRNLVIAEVVTGSGPLRPSRTLLVVLDRMVETVFLALMGTTMGVLFAVPLSFLGAKNL